MVIACRVMAEQITREDALTQEGYKHACHIMLYGDCSAKLFGKIPIKHIVLMQMRFDGLLGFPGGLVNPSKETLEAGLSRELHEEVGVAIPVGVDNHISSCLAPSCPRLITHFYIKKMTEAELREIEKAAVATATDHGLEVLGMVRVPLYFLKNGGGLPYFLSHSFISNSRAQLISALQRCGLVSQGNLDKAVRQAEQMRCTHSADPH
ncbi:U8 snoRNA-decapping enzyme [Paramisgurnus dabryanus]|uniref:U8 snoRNA-decapping enzyme n=1 Tax=Paramisgurnus dabryanus TaxID=90735 RepID=UPI0031F407CB